MRRLNKIAVLAVTACLAFPAFAQTSASLETEIQNTQKIASASGATSSERHAALVRLARLRQLSGDIEGAARNWLEAAAAIPGQTDDDALLACAYCLTAMGEWDRARAAIQPLLAKNARARFLNAAITALDTGDTSALAEIASASEYSQMRSEIYYLLWKTSGASESEKWRRQLISEFPQSPEARIASGAAAQTVTQKTSPLWLLFNKIELFAQASSVIEPSLKQASPAIAPTPAQAAVPQAIAQQTSVPTGVKLQTGLFSREANAQSLAADLRKAGFAPTVEHRASNSGEMWAVIVPAGADTNRSIRELREAGFESFPIK